MDLGLTHISGLAAALLVAALAPVARAELGKDSEKATVLNYDVEGSLLFVDGLGRPRSDAIHLLQPAAAAPSRALGLGRFRIKADWQAMDSASLTVVFRPDAANRAAEEPSGLEPREVDTRAGDVASGSPYKPMPRIRLLDAYQLNVAPGAALSGSFGVFEDMTPAVVAYPGLIAFGLETRLPAKFSGARLVWRRDRAPTATEPGGLTVELTVFQGDEDRAESLCERSGDPSRPCGAGDKSNDRAPVAVDPYQGAGVAVAWTRGRLGLGLTGGTFDEADVDGRMTEVFAKGDARWATTAFGRDLRLALDVRYVSERWRGDGVDVRPRVQHSQHLTAALGATADSFALLGAALGHSDQKPLGRPLTDHVPVFGYQIETGYLATIGKGLSLELMLTHERREVRDAAGGETGAIYHPNGNDKTLRRMGLSLTYELNDNA